MVEHHRDMVNGEGVWFGDIDSGAFPSGALGGNQAWTMTFFITVFSYWPD
jgi:hypothetical protein